MGKLFVVGIGPGGPDGMTIAARRALEAVSYTHLDVYKRQVVDRDAVALLQLVDDDLRGEGAADVVVLPVLLADSVFDGADGDVALSLIHI